jgi:hypothetical protein
MKIIFSVKVEVSNAGYDEDANADDWLLTPEIKKECVIGSKKKVCKHAVYIQCKLGILTYPPDANAQTIDKLRKRGRPKKAKTQPKWTR